MFHSRLFLTSFSTITLELESITLLHIKCLIMPLKSKQTSVHRLKYTCYTINSSVFFLYLRSFSGSSNTISNQITTLSSIQTLEDTLKASEFVQNVFHYLMKCRIYLNFKRGHVLLHSPIDCIFIRVLGFSCILWLTFLKLPLPEPCI